MHKEIFMKIEDVLFPSNTKSDQTSEEPKSENIPNIYKFCPGCGFKNENSFKFCPGCGDSLLAN